MKKILVLEDEMHVRKTIVDILSKTYQCLEAQDGKTGLELARSHQPDLILCDIVMPELSGFEVLQELSHEPVTASIPFIFLTGRNSPHERRQGMLKGADDYLTKPFTEDELLEAITVRLKKREALEEKHRMEMGARDETRQYDAITKLPNLSLLPARVGELLQEGDTYRFVTLLLVDIHRFREINEVFGRDCGDFLLRKLVDRLKKHQPKDNTLFRANSGSLLLVQPETEKSFDQAEKTCTKILDDLALPFAYEDHKLHLTFGIGGSLYDPDLGKTVNEILDQAEIALYNARNSNDKEYKFYHSDMKKAALDRITLENHLFQAQARNEFEIYFQPQVDIQTQELRGMEALLRWKNATFGWVMPNQFIPVAEENGAILEIGQWVLNNACIQAKKWEDQHGRPLRIAVNVSRRQLEEANFASIVQSALETSGLQPDHLELEITESHLMKESDDHLQKLQAIKSKGVLIAIDDFGTGYSSLASLSKFPIGRIKIDRFFVQRILTSSSDEKIVNTILDMAKSLNLEVTAEGVETEEQRKTLIGMGCTELQGALFSLPVSAFEFEKFFK